MIFKRSDYLQKLIEFSMLGIFPIKLHLKNYMIFLANMVLLDKLESKMGFFMYILLEE